jgi:hypothetical protein
MNKPDRGGSAALLCGMALPFRIPASSLSRLRLDSASKAQPSTYFRLPSERRSHSAQQGGKAASFMNILRSVVAEQTAATPGASGRLDAAILRHPGSDCEHIKTALKTPPIKLTPDAQRRIVLAIRCWGQPDENRAGAPW